MTCNKMTNKIKRAKIYKEIIKKRNRENMRRYLTLSNTETIRNPPYQISKMKILIIFN